MSGSLVPEDHQAILARGDDVEPAAAAQVGRGEVDAAALALAHRPVAHRLLGEGAAVPYEARDGDVVELAGVVAAVGAVALAGDQLGPAVAVEVGPDQVVVLADPGIDGVLHP